MKITTLVENTCFDESLKGEFGLSLLIETEKTKILFDMGQSDLFLQNAKKLSFDIEDLSFAVVSHAHYDHSGGLSFFTEKNSSAKIYLSSAANGFYYGSLAAKIPLSLPNFLKSALSSSKKLCRYIGIDRDLLGSNRDRFTFVDSYLKIDEHVFLLGEIEQIYPLAKGNDVLLEERNGRLIKDRFKHELAMVVKEEGGLVLFTGCGHNGLLNMLERVRKTFPGQKIKGVVGGFHLSLRPGKPAMAGTYEEIAEIGRVLLDSGVQYVITGHCTGEEACEVLEEVLQDRFLPLTTGSFFYL